MNGLLLVTYRCQFDPNKSFAPVGGCAQPTEPRYVGCVGRALFLSALASNMKISLVVAVITHCLMEPGMQGLAVNADSLSQAT